MKQKIFISMATINSLGDIIVTVKMLKTLLC